jgi:hypothetical protein
LSDIRAEMEAAYDAVPDDSAPSTADISADSTPSATPSDSTPDPVSDPTAPQASDTAAAAPETPAPGPIPFSRHQEILTNARKEYEWVKEHGDQQTVQQKLAILRRAELDPQGFLRDFAHAAGINPQQVFAPPPAPAAPPQPPQPDVLLENGQMVYSDTRMRELLQFEREQMLQQVNQEYAPLKQRAVLSDAQQRATHTAQQALSAAAQWPGFTDAKSEIGAFLQANPRATLHDAYIHVVPAKMAAQIETEKAQAYQKALTDLQTKAGAASTPAPRMTNATAPDTTRMSFRELLEAAAEG